MRFNTIKKTVSGGKKMYLQVRNLKKSYGEGGSYIQVLKGISTQLPKGKCVSFREPAAAESPLF